MRCNLLGKKKLALNSLSVLFQSREARALGDLASSFAGVVLMVTWGVEI